LYIVSGEIRVTMVLSIGIRVTPKARCILSNSSNSKDY
jgi:hypothetical protein